MSVLVIAEKPSVGMSLAAVLGAKERKDGYTEGNGYIVSWCVGHLVGLADAYEYSEKYGKWKREDLPIMPDTWKYVVFDGKQKQFNILRGLMSRADVESLVCATDAGREGELIYRFVYQMAGCKKPFKRLWISSMEENAIKKGFAELRDGNEYDPLFYSALCRAKADWLIGINATRLFSTLYNKTLNVGRVQTPTLAMLTERSAKISGFVKEKYHIVRLNMGGIEALSAHIADPQEAEKIRAAADKKAAVCLSLTKEQKSVSPPKLFDLTALQRDSNRLFGYTAQQTLDAAQKLYESKLITYPRTDSRYVTSDMAAGLPALTQTAAAFISAGASVPVNTGQVVNDAKVSDHHAIIPTAEIAKADISKLSETERNILSLTAARLVCAVNDKHIYEAIKAAFECNGYKFTAKGRVRIADGWKFAERHFTAAPKLNADADTEDGGALPPISEGQTFDNAAATVTEHYTQPPKHYTEDLLLSAMESAGAISNKLELDMPDDAERKGLGTPATRAAVIENLVKSGLIQRNDKNLLPTDKGVNLIKILPESVKSPLLTAEWENHLKRIEHGDMSDYDFMIAINKFVEGIVKTHATVTAENMALFPSDKRHGEIVGKCPRCGSDVTESAKGFCSNINCRFALFRNSKFFASKRKSLTKDIAKTLLDKGSVFITGLISEKTGKSYNATILLDDKNPHGGERDGYVGFRIEFENTRGSKK